MNDRILSLLSLATKAGKTVGGEMLVEKAVKEGKASLVQQRRRFQRVRLCAEFRLLHRELSSGLAEIRFQPLDGHEGRRPFGGQLCAVYRSLDARRRAGAHHRLRRLSVFRNG